MMVRESVGGAEDGQNIKVGVLGVICLNDFYEFFYKQPYIMSTYLLTYFSSGFSHHVGSPV